MKNNYFERTKKNAHTECWVNNPTREEARIAIEAGIKNCTTNPTYAMKQIQREPEFMNPIVDQICSEEKNDNQAAAKIQNACVSPLLEIFKEVFDPTTRTAGLVSLQGDPILEDDPNVIIAEIQENRNLAPNYLAKIPATASGIKAMEFAIKEDIPFIATEIMSISQAVTVCEMYNKVSKSSGNTPPMFITHITGIFDDHLNNVVDRDNIEISKEVLHQAGCAVGRKLYHLHQERNYPGILLGGGARGLHHFTEFVGADMAITINWKGTADVLIEKDFPVIEKINTVTPKAIIDELITKFPDFRLAWEENALSVADFETYGPVVLFRDSFIKGWEFLLKEIRKRR